MSKMLENLRDDINLIVKELQIKDEDFQLVRLTRYRQLLLSILEKFTTLEKSEINRWWWNFFVEPGFSIVPENILAVLPLLVRNDENVYFIIEDESGTKEQDDYWLYDGKIDAIISVLNELPFTEYYIVSKKLEWILCENHHDVLIGCGEPIIEKMKTFS